MRLRTSLALALLLAASATVAAAAPITTECGRIIRTVSRTETNIFASNPQIEWVKRITAGSHTIRLEVSGNDSATSDFGPYTITFSITE